MKLRPYQTEAVEAIEREWRDHGSTLLVMPTGTGKTVTFAHVIARRPHSRAIVIAHREELIRQGAATIGKVIDEECEIEMADLRADRSRWWKSRVVVASKDSLHERRLRRFDPNQFSTLIIDEAHHAVAKTYRRVIDHFTQNPDLRVLGVTATPDRLDEKALGMVFGSAAYVYEILDAIEDGYLVPVEQRTVVVRELDFSGLHTLAGDFNQRELADLMELERNLHAIADPIIKLARWNRVLIFAASIKHADRLCEILNRHRPGRAQFVHGNTPKDDRARILDDYRQGKFQFLVNVGVFTEGFDDPGIGMVAIARPTKSRALYAQMIGRGTRPAPGIIDGLETPEDRREAIAASRKPRVEVLDFEGQAGRHKLVTAADVLGGDYDDDVIERAAGIVAAADGESMDVVEALKEAARLRHEERKRAQEAEARKRAKLLGRAEFTTKGVNPFNVFDLEPARKRAWDATSEPSDAQLRTLRKFGVPVAGLTRRQASQLIGECIRRRQKGLCTFRMANQLKKRGIDPDVTFDEARRLLDLIAEREGWASRKVTA